MMCGVKLVGKRNTEELMDIMRLKEIANKQARTNCVRYYRHLLTQSEEDVLMKAMVHELDGKHKQGQLRMKWRKQHKRNIRIGLRKEDAADQCRWKKCRKSCRSSGMHLATSSHWGLNPIKTGLMMMMCIK